MFFKSESMTRWACHPVHKIQLKSSRCFTAYYAKITLFARFLAQFEMTVSVFQI